uniref:Molecule interacting with CasL protein 1 n=1 Tax=Latimeria chalumnae TaxID=7897 RepID=H3B992_LATCH
MNNPGAEQRDEAHVLFDNFVQAKKCKEALQGFQELCRHLELDPQDYRNFYQKLKSKLNYWKAKALWTKLDKRAVSHPADFNRQGVVCPGVVCLVVGAGPCGLRTAIELAFLGARVIVIEKRDTFSRNNVLHLWPFTIHDLRALGAKKFYGKFCSGSLDHISIRQLQLILLKAALILGIEVQLNVEFRGLLDPPRTQGAEKGWRASLQPSVHPVGRYEFNVLISAGGSRLVPEGFKKKELRGKLAIGITANFVNGHTAEEARVAEISGVARIYHQKFFHNLHNETGIDLENIVYYKDDTHYFVMTAKKKSLLKKGVILQDQQDIEKLLSKKNVDFNALLCYAREAANFCTEKKLPKLEFAVNHRNRPDVDMFDFTCMHRSEDAALVRERNGHALLIGLVGDCLVEPFWPLGTGVARGFLAAFDAAWMVRKWVMKTPPLEILAERESIYQLLSQTSPDNTSKNYNQYSIDPVTRYPNINLKAIKPNQVHHLYDVEDSMKTSKEAEKQKPVSKFVPLSDSVGPCEELLSWCQRHTEGYRNVKVKDLTSSWKSGLALCALINKFRPDLIDFDSLDKADTEGNNQKAFTVAEKELGISMIMTGQDMANVTEPDKLSMVMYLTQFYEAFKDAEPPNESADPVNKTKTISNVTKSAIFFLNQLKKNATLKRLAKEKTDPEEEMVKKPRKKDSSVNDQKVPLDSPLAPSDVCYFCSTRVYVLERGSAEGKFFHRSCFACHHCGTSLHLGSYVFNDKDGKSMHLRERNFNCTQHYLYQFSAHQETEDQKPNTTSQNSKSPEEEEDEEGDSLDTTSRSWPAVFLSILKKGSITLGTFVSKEEKTEVRMPDSSSLVEQVEKGLLEKCGMKLNVGKAECYNKEQSTLTANLPSESSDLTSSTPGSLVPSALNPAEEPGQQIAKSDSEMKISMRRLYLSTLEKKKLCRLSLGSDSDSENPGDTVTDSRSFITSSLSDHLNLPGASRGCKTDNLNFRKKEDPRPCSARAQACWEEPGFLIEGNAFRSSTTLSNHISKHTQQNCFQLFDHSTDFSQSDEESDDLSEEDDDWTFEEYAAKEIILDKERWVSRYRERKKYDTWKTKTIVRRAKEEEMKRFHKAQTIQRQLTEIEEKFGLLEQKGVELEKAIRGEGGKVASETIIEEWLHLVQTKNALVSEECELTIGARQLELEDQQSRLEQEFRRYINMEDSVKTAFDQKEEERILNEMVEVVDMRNALVNFLDQKRLKEINEQLHGLACADPKNSARCFQVQWS